MNTRVVEMNGSRLTQEQSGGKTVITRVEPLGGRAQDAGKSAPSAQTLPEQRAHAFNGLQRKDALQKFPELAPAYAALDAVNAKSAQQGLSEVGRKNAEISARSDLTAKIQADMLPQVKQQVHSRQPLSRDVGR